VLCELLGKVVRGVVDTAFIAGSPDTFSCSMDDGHFCLRRAKCTEGTTWVRGWEGEIPDAFRAQIALLRG